jgi:hypothetical protein
MKSLIILILTVVLCGGALLSKPSEQNFRDMIRKKVAEGGQKDSLIQVILHGGKDKADVFLSSCTYHDWLLWATVEREGKTIYTGAFSSWFASSKN